MLRKFYRFLAVNVVVIYILVFVYYGFYEIPFFFNYYYMYIFKMGKTIKKKEKKERIWMACGLLYRQNKKCRCVFYRFCVNFTGRINSPMLLCYCLCLCDQNSPSDHALLDPYVSDSLHNRVSVQIYLRLLFILINSLIFILINPPPPLCWEVEPRRPYQIFWGL